MKILLAVAMFAVACTAAPAIAADPAPAAAPAAKFSTASSTIGDLIDNAASKAVLEKYMPTLVSNPQMEMARSMTLKQIQGFVGDQLNDDLLAKVDADLAAIK